MKEVSLGMRQQWKMQRDVDKRKRVEGRMYLLQAFLNRHDGKSVTGKCVARNGMCAECWLC